MSTQTNIAKIYIALDCMLDTRQGAMVLVDDRFAFEVTTQPEYYTREEDLFTSSEYGTLSKTLLNQLLKDKADLVIGNSLKTKMHRFVSDLVRQLKEQAHSTPNHTGVAIEVNTYPYTFNENEYAGLLHNIQSSIKGRVPITLINLSVEQLDHRYVKDNYRCVIMYDYKEWMNRYEKEIKKSPLKDTCFYVPKLYFGTPPSNEELSELAKHNTDPFSFMEEVMMPLVPMQFLPIALYCVDIPLNKDVYSKF